MRLSFSLFSVDLPHGGKSSAHGKPISQPTFTSAAQSFKNLLNHPNYESKCWHGTLRLWVTIAGDVTLNTLLAKLLPFVEESILIAHCDGSFIVLIPLTYLRHHGSVHDVFARYLIFENMVQCRNNHYCSLERLCARWICLRT